MNSGLKGGVRYANRGGSRNASEITKRKFNREGRIVI